MVSVSERKSSSERKLGGGRTLGTLAAWSVSWTGAKLLLRLRGSKSERLRRRLRIGSEWTVVVSERLSLVSSRIEGGAARTRIITSHFFGSKMRSYLTSLRMRSKSSRTTASVNLVRNVDSVVIIWCHLLRSSTVRTDETSSSSTSSWGGGFNTRISTSQLSTGSSTGGNSKMGLGRSDPTSDCDTASQSVISLGALSSSIGGYWRIVTSQCGGGTAGRWWYSITCLRIRSSSSAILFSVIVFINKSSVMTGSICDVASQSVLSLGERGLCTGGYCLMDTSHCGGEEAGIGSAVDIPSQLVLTLGVRGS